MAASGTHVKRQGPEARGRRPLPGGEPADRDLGDGADHEGLADGDPDLGHEDDRVVRGEQAAHEGEAGREHGAEAGRGLEAPGVDGPRGGDGEDDVDDHEDHGQQPDHEIGLAVEGRGGTGDGREREPQDLGQRAHDPEYGEHEPAGGVDLDRFIVHGADLLWR